MPLTAINVDDTKVVIITQQFDEELSINAYVANDNYIPTGDPVLSSLTINEEEYHRSFRKEAKQAGHLVPEYCTNPEWNPDFNPEVQAEIEKTISEE
jgi:hypothetical protein